jgi:hypothetical protein
MAIDTIRILEFVVVIGFAIRQFVVSLLDDKEKKGTAITMTR